MHSLLTQLGYLDPGTGSIIIQAIIGVIAGIGLFLRRRILPVFSKIKALFSKRKKTTNNDAIDKDKED